MKYQCRGFPSVGEMQGNIFSLNENPFHLLNADYDATASAIVELGEAAEFEGSHDPKLLIEARQSLMTPRLRLQAELSWLPELTAAQVSKVVSMLADADSAEILEVVDHWPELAKANIAAHLCEGRRDQPEETIRALAAAWDEIDPEHTLQVVNATRVRSSFPSVDLARVREALDDLRRRHAAAAATAVWRSPSPGALMNALVMEEMELDPSSGFLRQFVREFDSRSEPDLSRIGTSIDEAIAGARKVDGRLADHVERIVGLLSEWDAINQPVQIFDREHGHEEGRSKALAWKVRDLTLDLANEHDRYAEALRLVQALIHTFPELESVAEKLRDDVNTLEELVETQERDRRFGPLLAACEAAKANPTPLRRALAQNGFSARGQGMLADLVTAFHRAFQGEADDRKVACLIVRDLALSVNNEKDDPEAAFRLMHGLIDAGGREIPSEVLSQLQVDRAILHRNWKMPELQRNKDSVALMCRTIDEMLEFAQGNDRQGLLKLKESLESRQRRQRVKYAVYGVIGLAVVGWVWVEDQAGPRRSNTPASTTAPSFSFDSGGSTTAASYEEAVPPVGTDRLLSTPQVRYCIYQGERIDYLRLMATTNAQIDRFNAVVDDFNARCSSFQYRIGVLGTVQGEVPGRAATLQAEARRIADSW